MAIIVKSLRVIVVFRFIFGSITALSVGWGLVAVLKERCPPILVDLTIQRCGTCNRCGTRVGTVMCAVLS